MARVEQNIVARETYHFGLNGWEYWNGELPFPVKRTQARLRMSFFSFLIRAILLGYICYVIWRWIGTN